MEVLAAVSLTGNIVQFVTFASSLISSAREIHTSASGTTQSISTLESVYGQLDQLSTQLQATSDLHSQVAVPSQLTLSMSRIWDLSRQCEDICKQLLEALDKLKGDCGAKSTWQSAKIAFKALWK